jgi:phosphate starvation-inducible PhoH-like protein
VAVSMLAKNKIRKIVLARPAVEAAERLGFLPGDLKPRSILICGRSLTASKI